MQEDMSDSERDTLRSLFDDYGTDGILDELADWLDDEDGEYGPSPQMAQRVRDFKDGKTQEPSGSLSRT